MAQSHRSGVALCVMDGFFAATALAKDLMLVTRNVTAETMKRSVCLKLVNRIGRRNNFSLTTLVPTAGTLY